MDTHFIRQACRRFKRFLCVFLHKIRRKERNENMENIIFGIMVVIALGAGVFTCIYEIGGSRKTTSETENKDTEKGTN